MVVKQAKGRGSIGRMFYHYLNVVEGGREASCVTSGCSGWKGCSWGGAPQRADTGEDDEFSFEHDC